METDDASFWAFSLTLESVSNAFRASPASIPKLEQTDENSSTSMQPSPVCHIKHDKFSYWFPLRFHSTRWHFNRILLHGNFINLSHKPFSLCETCLALHLIYKICEVFSSSHRQYYLWFPDTKKFQEYASDWPWNGMVSYTTPGYKISWNFIILWTFGRIKLRIDHIHGFPVPYPRSLQKSNNLAGNGVFSKPLPISQLLATMGAYSVTMTF